ncbi:cytochrome b [Alteromonas sp. 1_MG-2023]|uniref:cytochrome b n=1 Tax=Alteromonas sp. 1_MG-2023 TaxID=3062669 RepID=UPI0026E26343|nr:cytochrome b [Alteromonas sp. 1_MG-2023]MDO6567001.1 cytochrome b [Alteromonas sp. 1_MG-2023]
MKQRWPIWLILVHWLTLLVVIGMFSSGLWMTDLTYYSEWYKTAPHWHKSVGLLLLAITLTRLFTRIFTKRPLAFGSKVEQLASKAGHSALYLVLLALFTSGYLISTADGRAIEVFSWFAVPGLGEFIEHQEDLAGEVHFYLAWTLIVLASLHGLAALKHHVVDKDATLKQMLRLHSLNNLRKFS